MVSANNRSLMGSKNLNDSKRPRLDSGLGSTRPSTSNGNNNVWDDDGFDEILTQANLKDLDELIMNSKPLIDAKEVTRTPKRKFAPNNCSKTSKSTNDLISGEDIYSDLDRSSQENGKYKKEIVRLQNELMEKDGQLKIKNERIQSLDRQIYELKSSLVCIEQTQRKTNQELELKREEDLKKKQTEINFLANEKQKLQQKYSQLQQRLTALETQNDQHGNCSGVEMSQNINLLTQGRIHKDIPVSSEKFPNRKSFYTGASQRNRKRPREEQISDDHSNAGHNFQVDYSLCKAVRQCILTEKLKEKRCKYWYVSDSFEAKTGPEMNSLKHAATAKV